MNAIGRRPFEIQPTYIESIVAGVMKTFLGHPVANQGLQKCMTNVDHTYNIIYHVRSISLS